MIVGHLNIGAGRVVWQVLVLTRQWTYIRILCVSINLSKRASLQNNLPSSKLSTTQRRGTEDFIFLVSFRMVVSILTLRTCLLSSQLQRMQVSKKHTSTSSATVVTQILNPEQGTCSNCWTNSRN